MITGRLWTEEEKQFLEDHFMIYPKAKLARMLGRTEKAIQSKMNELKLFKKQPYRKPRKAPQIFEWVRLENTTDGRSQISNSSPKTWTK